MTADMNAPCRRRFQFTTRHLLWLTALVALAITGLMLAVEKVGYAETDVEILKVHDSGTVEFLVLLPDGFAQSGVSIPPNTSPADYKKLVGTKFEIRYRAIYVFGRPVEDPTMVAFERVQTLVDSIAREKQVVPKNKSTGVTGEH
jgi:hypothetical protein